MTTTRRKPPAEEDTSEKQVLTLRMRRELVSWMKGAAAETDGSVTRFVTLAVEGLRSFFGLPTAAAGRLEQDRRKLGMGPLEYMEHVLYSREIAVREKGPGFDAPKTGEGTRRRR